MHVEPLAQQLVAVGGILHAVLTHMEAWAADGRSAPDAPPPETVLGDLLVATLAPLADARPDAAATAVDVLEQVAGVLEHELLLVAPEPAPGPPRRR